MELLGRVVRELRTAQKLTQAELGTRAGYRSGAGVSISRLENGQLSPGTERLQGVAEALGLTLEELAARASGNSGPSEAADADATAPDSRPAEGLKERYSRIEREINARKTEISALNREFAEARERARDGFLTKFIELAGRIEGARQPDPTQLPGSDENADGRAKETKKGPQRQPVPGADGSGNEFQLAWLSRVASLAAVAAGSASVLPLLAAAPLAAFGAIELAKRNRKRQQELDAKLGLAETELEATTPGFEALRTILPRATGILDYIAVHASHALARWENQIGTQIGPGPISWEPLNENDRKLYEDFFEIAAAQITVLTVDVPSLLATQNSNDLNQLLAQFDTALTHAEDAIKARV